MRHRKKTTKLQRKSAHRQSLIANQICSLIEHRRIRTTLAKAKAVKPVAEKMLTLGKKAIAAEGKKDKLHYFNQALAFLKQKQAVKDLFRDIAPAHSERQGGYVRIIKLGQRTSDAAPMSFLEWVDAPFETEEDLDTDDTDIKNTEEAENKKDENESDKSETAVEASGGEKEK